VNDRLPYRIRDGVRYAGEVKRGKKILEEAKKRRGEGDEGESSKTGKRRKATYMVNSKKFASVATREEMVKEFSEEDPWSEDMHRIVQCQIR
jgi:hypothetical protein